MRVLCLFSNGLEDPGVISSENGKWPSVPDHQLEFLEAQIQKIKDEAYKGAVLIAVHHPPFSYAELASRRARERHGQARRGGFGLSRGAEGIYPRARAAQMGEDADESHSLVFIISHLSL